MLEKCLTHNCEFTYTCPFCNIEYEYLSRTELIGFFRKGLLGQDAFFTNDEERGAYAHGKRLKQTYLEKNES